MKETVLCQERWVTVVKEIFHIHFQKAIMRLHANFGEISEHSAAFAVEMRTIPKTLVNTNTKVLRNHLERMLGR